MKQRPEYSSAWIVIELVSMNCIADQPLELAIAETLEVQRPVRDHADRVDDGRPKARIVAGSASAANSHPWRSIAASMPHGDGIDPALCWESVGFSTGDLPGVAWGEPMRRRRAHATGSVSRTSTPSSNAIHSGGRLTPTA
jgi:hypothetical protein